MADREQLYNALRNADAAGDTAAAQRLADYIRSLPDDAPQGFNPVQAVADMERAETPQRSLPQQLGRQIGLTARAGAEGLAALPAMLWNGPAAVLNQYAGTNLPRASIGPALDFVGLPRPETATERVSQDVAGAMASAGGTAALGNLMSKAAAPVARGIGSILSSAPGSQVATAAGSAGGSGIAREAGYGPGVQTAAGLVGGLGAGLGANAARVAWDRRASAQAARDAIPTVEQLKQRAASEFDDAQRRGVTASQQQTQQLATDMQNLAKQEGLISPTGRVSEAYPKAREALRMLDDYATGPMDVRQMQTVRKVLADAAGSSDRAERRIATMMLDRFDDFTSPLAPQLAEGRALYARAMRGDQLETLRELAGSRAGQFTGSGYENALRTEYRQLNNRIIKGQERGWTPEQQEAIKRVAEGTRTSNALRNIGKLAPTGSVSFGISGGVPFAVGSTIGGPALGGILSGTTMGSGFLAREIAEKLGRSYAKNAETLARSGGLLAPPLTMPVTQGLLGSIPGGLLGGYAAARSDKKDPDR